MKSVKADKALLDDILGLSCIENYLLYLMKSCNYNYRYLYALSFVSFFDIAAALLDESVSYAYFNKIPRLQDTARREGLLSLIGIENIKEASQFDYCCIKITPDYVKARYGREFWRDDHYMLLCGQEDDHWIYLNDNPRDIIVCSDDELSDMYAGHAICFHAFTEVPKTLETDLFFRFSNAVLQSQKPYTLHTYDLKTARDLVGILKITRKRIFEYSALYMDTDFMADYLLELEKAYAVLEYMRQRRNADPEKVKEMLVRLQMHDLFMTEQLKRNVKAFVNKRDRKIDL